MTDSDRSRAWRVMATIGRGAAKDVGYSLSVMKPPEQMNAQTMIPPEPIPPRRDEYRP